MRTLFSFLALMILAANLNAQYIYNDFDGNQNEPFSGWPNSPAVVANPSPSGINPSPNVAQWVRSGEQWAHVYAVLPGKINFTTGTIFRVKAYSPIACQVLFKLEDKTNGGIFTEVMGSITTPNQWVQLEYNFSSAQSGLYDKIVIFFDFAVTTSNTFYFDEVTGPSYSGAVEPKPYLALDVQDNFENDGWGTITNWNFQDPDLIPLQIVNDPINPSNHVANYTRSGNFEWANAQFILEHRMDLTIRNTFDLRVYFPSANNYTGALTPTAAMKLQNSLLGPNAWTTQTQVLLPVTQFDQWVTLTFNFSQVADSMNYDQVVIQFGGEGHLVAGQFYFDDLHLAGSSGNGALTFFPANGAVNVPVNVNPQLNFSVPVTMADGSAITNGLIPTIVTFKKGNQGGPNVTFTGSINAQKTQITIDPSADLESGTAYYLALNNQVIRYEGADLIPGQNITFTTAIAAKPYLALDVQDNFENNGWGTITTWVFQDPDLLPLQIVNDPVNPSNHVANYTRSGNFEWANAQFILAHRMDLTERNTFKLKVYFPSANNYTGALTPTASMKLQNSLLGGNAWSTQTEVIQLVAAFDQWTELTFNFEMAADSMNYDQVVIQFGGEGHFVPGQFYFDDLELQQGSANGVLTFFPANGATGVSVNVQPLLQFSVPVEMANGNPITPATIQQAVSITVGNPGGTPVAYSGQINSQNTVITLIPQSNLLNGQVYYVNLANNVIRYQGGDPIPAQSCSFTTAPAQKPYLALNVQDNFENNGWGTITNWMFQDPEMLPLNIITDPLNSANHVANYTRSGNFEWTNAQFILNHRMNLTERHIFELKVLFPSTNNYTGALAKTASVKLQNSLMGPNAWMSQTEIVHQVVQLDNWVTLQFDFAAAADSMNYDQVVVQLGGEGHFVPAQFYFDDFELKQIVGIQSNVKQESAIYPNPASDYFTINGIENIRQIVVKNSAGQEIIRQNADQAVVNISVLQKGLYLVFVLDSNNRQHIFKLIRQ